MSEQIVLPTHPFFKNLTGKKFGRLSVVSYAGRIGKPKISAWRVICDCGTEKVISATHLQTGVQSCGCLRIERIHEAKATHFKCDTPEYSVWSRMIARCENKNSKGYVNYGGRGILVCERWRNSFESFLEDMGERPSPKHELDRINNGGDYTPENCRWATRIEQARNKRSNHRITFLGETYCLSEWGEILGFPKGRIQDRLRKGWTIERALTTPVIKS